MKIAVEFDGTLVENRLPVIGKEIPFAFYILNTLQERGHEIILWTARTGKQLVAAEEFCEERGIEFFAINKNHPNENYDEKTPRKIEADVFIDGKNIAGIPNWNKIFYSIHPEEGKYVTLAQPAKKWRRWKRWRKKRWEKNWK